MSIPLKSAERREFLDGRAEIVQLVMRVFAMLAFRFVTGEFHPQFRRHVLIGERGREAVAQGVERATGEHLIACAFHGLQIQARLPHELLEGFGKPAPSAAPLPGERWHDEDFRLVVPASLFNCASKSG